MTMLHMITHIESITMDYGLLQMVPLSSTSGSSQYIDLQPDGNSFNMMKGLIKMKRM
ncbi:hypothetical protein EV401DRAFT_1943612 [Pisolithus croceorrhizus]|nr:hypothetical protein EV401DRAFT_1943612 [Pisolithus croceorrhizus]